MNSVFGARIALICAWWMKAASLVTPMRLSAIRTALCGPPRGNGFSVSILSWSENLSAAKESMICGVPAAALCCVKF